MATAKYGVTGMFCSNCAEVVSTALLKVNGVKSAKVDLAKNIVVVSFDESKANPAFMRKAVKRAGYDLLTEKSTDPHKQLIIASVQLGLSILILLLGILMSLAHVIHGIFHVVFANDVFGIVIGSVALVVLGYPYFRRAIKMLFSGSSGMDMLISVSSLSAYALSLYISIVNIRGSSMTESYFDALCLILSVVTIGHFVENRVKALSGKQVKIAAKSQVTARTRIRNGDNWLDVMPEQVVTNNVFIVPQGQAVPADGKVQEGKALLDMSALTGEARSVAVVAGDQVFAGTVVVKGQITGIATADAIDSLEAKLENEAYALSYKKGKMATLSDNIARYFVPAVFLLAIVSFIVNYFTPLAQGNWQQSLVRSVAVLIVSCPCAFGLAVPLASLNGYYLALRKAIVFKSGNTFEKVKNINAVLFDKTGTLTDNSVRVSAFFGDAAGLGMAKTLEAHSGHPLANAILLYRPEVPAAIVPDLTPIKEIPGEGIGNDKWYLGKKRRGLVSPGLDAFIASNPDCSFAFLENTATKTTVAAFAFEASARPDAHLALDELRREGIKTYMLTGDSKIPALRLGLELGFAPDEVFFALLPDEKARKTAALSKRGMVAYVGDGINDAEALATAGLSIAMDKATPAAKERADCLLLTPDLMAIPDAVRISRRSYRVIAENFVWAFAYNLVLIPLAMTGYLWMWMCALVMILSNLTLMANSIRAGYDSGPKRLRHEIEP